jgi:phytoene dehydrogenase-like protein
LFPIQYREMWTVRNKTLADLLNDYVKDPILQRVLGAQWGYYGLPPSKLLVKNGAAEGVVVSGQKLLPARAVVSNASALTTFKEMLPREVVPADYMKKLEGYRPSLSSFLVWFGLNKELRVRIKGYSTQVTSGLDLDNDYQAFLKGEVETGALGVTIYDNLYKGYSRPGTSTVVVDFLSGYEPWRKFETDYRAGRKKEYYKEKERWTNILIRRAEKEVIPGLSSLIEVKESATPLTNWRFTRNPGGAIYGFDESMDNAFMNRINNRTPIKGLYLASAWGFPGGGYGGVLQGEKIPLGG